MRVRVVTLRYSPSLGGFDERPLADFVRDKEVLAVREHFFCVHDLPHLACLVTYQDPATPPSEAALPARGNDARWRDRPDPAADLSPKDRVLFGSLREWRAARARKEGVPPFVLFSNRELLAIVRAKPKTPTALQALDGVGEGKVERYGQRILEILNGRSAGPAPAAPAVPSPGPAPAPPSPAGGAA